MKKTQWLIIIGKVLIYIAQGMNEREAVKKTAKDFGVNEDLIWKHW